MSEKEIEHYIAPEGLDDEIKNQSITVECGFWGQLWINLRKNVMFWMSAVLIFGIILIVAFPGLFSKINPATYKCLIENSLQGASKGHPMGFDIQGCDIFSQLIYGARPSVFVGAMTTIIVFIIGGTLGAFAGYYGRLFDTIISRISDIFFAIPFLLAAIVILQTTKGTVWSVIFCLALFGWPQLARITRASVLETKNLDYVTAAKSLGVSKFMRLIKHIIPNAISPMLVSATMSLGGFIVAEATLSFLGIGLPVSMKSWGYQIASAQQTLRDSPSNLLWPSLFLALTVLGFILLGDALRDALDPKNLKKD